MQDPFDLAGLVRPFTKWEYTLASGVNVKEVLRRAHAVAHSAPCAPVFLALPRETLAQPWDDAAVRSYPERDYGAVGAGGADPEVARRIAERLRAAERPLAITAYLGRNPAAVRELEALATEAGVQVLEYAPSDLNLRRDSPCHAGHDLRPAIDRADLLLLLDVDVPWLRQDGPSAEHAEVIQIDVDPIKQDFPMWGFPAGLRVRGDCAIVLAQVRSALAALRAQDGARAAQETARVAERIAGWQAGREAREARRAAAAAARGRVGALGADFVCATLAAALSPRDLVVNEAVRNGRAVLQQSARTLPGTYIGATGGGLGFSGGMALGARLACPDRTVVRVVGDGSFQFGNPSAEYEVAQQYGLPVLTVILDYGGWAAVKNATQMVHPDGAAQAADAFQARLDGPVRRLEAVAEAFGAYGEAVDDPDALEPAIGRALQALRAGRAAVLRVAIGPF
jgi:acetolactate synthase-1/2/3 large subunit